MYHGRPLRNIILRLAEVALSSQFDGVVLLDVYGLFRKVLRRKRFGVHGLELWTEGRRSTQVLKWRAGIWRRIFIGKKSLIKWQRHAQHQQDIELAVWVTERNKRRWKGDTSPYAIQQAVLRALSRNAWACSLKRSMFNAWAAHSCLMIRVNKQVRLSVSIGCRQ